MADGNSSKSWICYCALFAGIIIISVLYTVELTNHAKSKEVNNFNTCSMKLHNCDLELHMIEQKYNKSKLAREACQNQMNKMNDTGEKLMLDIYQNGKYEDILPSNHEKYKYSALPAVSAATTLNQLDYLIMWCFIMIKCFVLFYYILP